MQICLVTDAWSPQINGVVTTLSRTAATLAAWGHRVLLITPDRFRTLPCPTYPEIRLALVTPAAVGRLLTDFVPDAVHIATEGPLGWAARSACRRLGLDFTTSYHTRFPEYLRLRLPVPLPLGYALVRRFHRPARRTMAAPTIIDELSARSFPHLAPWSRGVDTHLFRPRRRPTASRPRPVFVSVGRVAVEKNLPAFLDLDVEGDKWVIGDGPALADLRRDYPGVRFFGAKRGEELAALLAAADVLVFPSRTDTFGLVLLEAMACGVPVAAFPVTGPRFLVREGENGCLDRDLGAAVERALQVDRATCRESVAAYSWEACTRQFVANLAVNPRPGGARPLRNRAD